MMAGQTINDRLLAARHSLAGQGLAKSVCKATTEEMIAPKKKHLDCKCTLCLFFATKLRCMYAFDVSSVSIDIDFIVASARSLNWSDSESER